MGPIQAIAVDGTRYYPIHFVWGGKMVCALGMDLRAPQPLVKMKSDDVRAVTCPLCEATQEFKAARAELDAVLKVRNIR